MTYGPDAGKGSWATLAVVVAVVVALAVLTIAGPAWVRPQPRVEPAVPAIPQPSWPNPSALDAAYELPIIVTDLPDAASTSAAAEYGNLRLRDPGSAYRMWMDSWKAVHADAAGQEAVDRFGAYLTGKGSRPSAAFPFGSEFEQEFDRFAVPALQAFQRETQNADRLNNAAVALVLLSVAVDHSGPFLQTDSPDILGPLLRGRAMRLLELAQSVFRDHRALTLNRAFFISVAATACGPSPVPLEDALAVALPWLLANPSDLLARLLVGSLQSRHPLVGTTFAGAQDSGTETAIRTLTPLANNTSTRALGYAAIGDAYLAGAINVMGQAPFQARRYAELARSNYDLALGTTADAGLLEGRAQALQMSGARLAALASQRRALAANPDSAEVVLSMARLQASTGDFRGARESADRALSMSLQDSSPQVKGARLRAADEGLHFAVPGDQGWLGYSFGRPRLHAGIYAAGTGLCGGGTFVVPNDVIPAHEPEPWRIGGEVPESALIESLKTSLVLADSAAAERSVDLWDKAAAVGPLGSNPWSTHHRRELDDFLPAVAIASRPQSVDSSDTSIFSPSRAGAGIAIQVLRNAGAATGDRGLFARAAVICRQAADQRCQAEATYYAGDAARASALFQSEYQKSHNSAVGLEAGFAAWQAGDANRAHSMFEAVLRTKHELLSGYYAMDPARAHELLGDLALDASEPAAALDHFEEALAALDAVNPTPWANWYTPYTSSAQGLAQRVHNNRGVAMLWRLAIRLGGSPRCDGVLRDACSNARDDFAAALALDPRNPHFLQNIGWVDRLLNAPDRAATEFRAAAKSAAYDYPALNDLGVLEAQMGDRSAAEASFKAALAADVSYHRAAWNLGVLLMDQPPSPESVIKGQAYLARATKLNASLRGKPLQYRLDNQIYRSGIGSAVRPVNSAPGGGMYGTGAAVLGTLGMLSGLADPLTGEIRGRALEMIPRLRPAALVAAAAWLRRRFAIPDRWLVGRRRSLLMTWLPTLVLLALVTVWTAVTASVAGRSSAVVIALLGVAFALLVHECGHLAAACLLKCRLRPAASPQGMVLSMLLLPFHVSSGPYLGHSVLPGARSNIAWWVRVAGPLANVAAAVAIYLLYVVQPMPLLRLVVQIQLSAAAFSLLPLKPLDGAGLARAYRRRLDSRYLLVVIPMGLAIVLGGAGLSSGAL